jgi:hypothetical protein
MAETIQLAGSGGEGGVGQASGVRGVAESEDEREPVQVSAVQSAKRGSRVVRRWLVGHWVVGVA